MVLTLLGGVPGNNRCNGNMHEKGLATELSCTNGIFTLNTWESMENMKNLPKLNRLEFFR